MRNIVTEEVYQKHIKDECNRVRSLTSETSTIWTYDPRPKNIVWEEDDIAKMPGAGGKKGKLLVSAGITKVNQLKSQTDEQLLTFANNTAGISFGFLTKLRDTHTLEGACPHQHKDYRKDPNPYLAKYGEDEWRNEIEKTVFMKKYMSIRELIKKMYDNSKKIFEGTTHQEDWYFYHDAFSQMTANSTVEWMKAEGYYEKWLVPQNGCNDWIAKFGSRPVGNSPEFMPLDNALNNDLQLSKSLHCAITAYIEDPNDERKFSMGTPNTIVKGIIRLWGTNVPSSDRIEQDCDKALRSFGCVYEHGGRMVPNLANRSGHRNLAAGRNTTGWGGVRVKNLLRAEEGRWLHPDAVDAKRKRTADIIRTLENDDFSTSSADDSTVGERSDVSDDVSI